jgi:hypothetical protein
MPTPALKPFLDSTGRIVHHLNTIVVGLSAVESGAVSKPATMDITWAPRDVVTSSRQARAFALRSTLVFLAEELNSYIDQITRYPGLTRSSDWDSMKKADRFVAVQRQLKLQDDFNLVASVLIAHWRNRNIHGPSGAKLTHAQRKILIDAEETLKIEFKNLNAQRLLDDFDADSPSLKDTSSLVAMAIRFVKRLDQAIPEPTSAEKVNEWFVALGLHEQLDRVRRVAAAKGKEAVGVETFIRTNCPELLSSYLYYCGNAA